MYVKGHNQEKVYTQGTAAEAKRRAVMQIFSHDAARNIQLSSCVSQTQEDNSSAMKTASIFQTII